MAVRGALVVPYEAAVDEELLDAVEGESGKRFSWYGGGMFGTEVMAAVYSDAAGDLLIEARAVEVPVKAVLVRTAEVEDAVAIRQVVGDRLDGWSEQMVRSRIGSEVDGDPQLLVALAMAAGGALMERESRELLQRAAAVDAMEVRGLAEYARRIAAELAEAPFVWPEQGARVAEVLRPEGSAESGGGWVTARPGVAGRQIPRPVTWLCGPEASDVVSECGADENWPIQVVGQASAVWLEEVWVTKDERTAIHAIEHPALGVGHIAVHGADVTGVVATLLSMDDGLETLDGPPEALPDTAPEPPR